MNSQICQKCDKYYNCFAPCNVVMSFDTIYDDISEERVYFSGKYQYKPSFYEILNEILSEKQLIVWHFRLDGESWESIATEMGITRQAARTHHRRGKKKLNKYIVQGNTDTSL